MWDFRRYGSATDPVHKSHLNDLTGDYGCPTRFRYERDERARVAALGGVAYNTESVRGDAAAGTAAHETIARALTNPSSRDAILAGRTPSTNAIRDVFVAELDREAAGRRVEWYDKDPAAVTAERVAMVAGLLGDLHRYVARVELVEPAFLTRLGAYWLAGHIDLVYRPRANPETIAIADWKTGASRPDQIELDHGWEAGVYSVAVKSGMFLDRAHIETARVGDAWSASVDTMHTVTHASRYIAERECAERALARVAAAVEIRGASTVPLTAFGAFPSEIYHVHLADYVPYKRAGKKQITRPEDLAHFGLDGPGEIKYVAGDRRGAAWLRVRLSEHDVPRVEHRLRNVVGMIRMGRFVDQVGERCKRCPFAGDCLTTGYAARGEERAALERGMRGVDTSSADDLVID